tara:strand:+ start:799 stop:3300 length:2502 start_codon:yes stop_codon:yes gene_type:complete
MSDTILAGKFTVNYFEENRQKSLRFSGTFSDKDDTQIQIDIYDATEDLMNQGHTGNKPVIFKAVTPGEFQIGKIEAGDNDPWFIDQRSVEHIIGDNANFTGCALKSVGWTRVTTSNTGIVIVPMSASTLDDTDIGKTVTETAGSATGTLLDWFDDGTLFYAWVRPSSFAAGDDWDFGSGALTVTAGNSGTISAVSHTGEMVWTNIFTSGALVSKTHIYAIQNGIKMERYNDTGAAIAEDWWTDGSFDRAFPIKDWQTAAFPTIDEGYITVHANQYTTNHFPLIVRANTTSGGNISAGLTSGNDITNNTGYASVTTTAVGVDDFTVGDEIIVAATDTRAIITQIDGSSPTYTFHYYLIGDPLVDFTTGIQTIAGVSPSTGSATKDGIAVALQGPALTTWFDGNAIPTLTYANAQVDIDDDAVDEEYAATLDLLSCLLAEMTEWTKYIARRGSTFQMDGVDGEQWVGFSLAIFYATITGTVGEGSVVTGATSGATGTVVSNPGGTSNVAILRDVRGTFVDAEDIYLTDTVHEFASAGLTVAVIVPQASNSIGTLAGTTFFFQRGYVPVNYVAAEENLFSVIDNNGVTKVRPTTVTLNMVNLLQYDWALWYRLLSAGGDLDKVEYGASGGEAISATAITVTGAITADTVGKSTGGRIVLYDFSTDIEYTIRYASWVTSTFTLMGATQAAIVSLDSTADENHLTESGHFASGFEVGDLVYNVTTGGISYISDVVSANEIAVSPALAGLAATDNIQFNVIPVAVLSADFVYVPFMVRFRETGGTEGASMVYVAPVESLAKLRNTSTAAIKNQGIAAAITISGDAEANLARIPDTVYGA